MSDNLPRNSIEQTNITSYHCSASEQAPVVGKTDSVDLRTPAHPVVNAIAFSKLVAEGTNYAAVFDIVDLVRSRQPAPVNRNSKTVAAGHQGFLRDEKPQ